MDLKRSNDSLKRKGWFHLTIYDIAREAGVSASTVSRVVNGKAGVNAETKSRIQALLDRYHYAPNETARGLVTQNNRMIGIMICDIRNQHYTKGAYIVEQEFALRGYHSIFLTTGGRPETQAEAIRSLKQRHVAGAVLIGSTFQNAAVEQAIRQYFRDTPVIMVNGYLDLLNVCGIITDERAGVRELVRRFVEMGHRSLAFVNLEDTPSNALKIQGFLAGLADAELDAENAVVHLQGGYEGSPAEISELLRARPDLDGIVFSDDLLACIGGKLIASLGIAVPERMIYAGINNSVFSLVASPSITCIDNQIAEACRLAAKRLEEALDGTLTERLSMIQSVIVERESTGSPNAGPIVP